MSDNPLVQFKQVEKSYLDNEPIFSNLDLSIDEKEFVFLTGVSGSGKSTFFKLIMGLEKLNKAEVTYQKTIVNKLSPDKMPFHRREIGMVFQDQALLKNKTVLENILLPLFINGASYKQINLRAKVISKQFDIEKLLKQKVSSLSGGEQQLTAIARASIHKPKIILADEPTANLDQKMAARIIEILDDLNQRGTTIIIATHDINLIKSYQKRTLFIKNRNIVDVV